MVPGLRCAVLAVAVLLAAAGSADARVICVDPARAECETAPGAFTVAQDGDTIEIAAIEVEAPLSSAADVSVTGAGEGRTILADLTLEHPAAGVSGMTVRRLDLAATATHLTIEDALTLRDGGHLRAVELAGTLTLDGPDVDAVADSVVVEGELEACGGHLLARHATVVGPARECDGGGGRLELRDSVVTGAVAAGVEVDDFSLEGVSVGADRRLERVPVDAGSPEPLAEREWFADRAGVPRIADGDGDGALERDPGAFELPSAASPLPAGNLLVDPGGEVGGAWAFTEGFTRERYDAAFLPPLLGTMVGGGDHVFAGGVTPTGTALQRVDLSGVAPEIDDGRAAATLSGLLGGYFTELDAASLEATFVDPGGAPLGTVALAGPTPAERAHGTMLLPRSRTDPIPPLTRAVDVTMRATLATGQYDDAYFDNLGLSVAVDGVVTPPPAPPSPGLKSFVGVRSRTALATVGSNGRIGVRLICPDGTVQHCDVVLTLTGVLARGETRERLAKTSAVLAPGAERRVHLKLPARARAAVEQRRRMRMIMFAAARDGQDVEVLTTIPLTVQWPRKPAKKPKRGKPRQRSQAAGSVPAGSRPG